MANMYMKLGTHTIKGGATASYTGDPGVTSSGGWFAIRSLSWHAARSVTMDIGNGMNKDTGMSGMSEMVFTKEMDGASEVLLSRMYVPGKEGDTVDVIITKPDRQGKGQVIYLLVEMENGRIVDYSISVADGSTPFESLALAYSKIKFKHWNEDQGGNLDAGGDVTFDIGSGQALSHAIEAL